MQKAINIFSVLGIIALAFWVYMQSRAISTLQATVIKLTPPANPAETANNNTTAKTSVTGQEFWDALQSKVQKIDLTFKNNNS